MPRKDCQSDLVAALEELSSELSFDARQGLFISRNGDCVLAGQGEPAAISLRDHLYARYFCRWRPEAAVLSRDLTRASGEPAFVAGLRAAAGGATCWEPGWRICKVGGAWAFVSNGRLNLFVDRRAHLDPRRAAPGAPVRVRVPCARENMSPGFFYLVGRAGPIDRQRPHSKLYVNLAPEGAAPLIEGLSSGPRLARLRFEAKVANAPTEYCRVDTALVYVEHESLSSLLTWLRGLRRSHPAWFRDGTPLFTRPLGPGLALAEESGGDPSESFGQRCCRLVAEEILAALAAGERSDQAWLSRITSRFAREGTSLAAPGGREAGAPVREPAAVSIPRRPGHPRRPASPKRG